MDLNEEINKLALEASSKPKKHNLIVEKFDDDVSEGGLSTNKGKNKYEHVQS